MKLRLLRAVALALALVMFASACGGDDADEAGAAPECVAPSDAGGGWDFPCRSIGQLFEDLELTENVVVTNQPGGGGGVEIRGERWGWQVLAA